MKDHAYKVSSHNAGRFNHTQIAKTAEQLGMTIIRWGLVLTLIGAGGMKFTATKR